MSQMSGDQRAALQRVLGEVAAERERQHRIRGELDLPRGEVGLAELEVVLHLARQQQAEGTPSWDAVLLEKVIEAVAERSPRRLRGELLQVAAVICQWIEAIDGQLGRDAADGRSFLEPQPAPTPDNTSPDVEEELIATVRRVLPEGGNRDRLIEDIRTRAAQGRERYGGPLQVNNGRNHLADEYQEEIDAAFYAQARVLQQRARGLGCATASWRLQRILETALLARGDLEFNALAAANRRVGG